MLLGLSGGIDSALVATLAADALGPDHVDGVSMPTRYSSEGTRSDASVVAERSGSRSVTIADRASARGVLRDAARVRRARAGLAEENLQARIRGVLLMTLSNKFGWLVLTTGNKSEMAVGYSTLYGDMAGGFAPIKDVPKTLVFALARRLNEHAGRELIPSSIIERPPSAELRDRPEGRPSRCRPTSVLDPLHRGLRRGRPLARGDRAPRSRTLEVAAARRAPRRPAEYKRRQAPPGMKVTPKAFGQRPAPADHEPLGR